jgi:hypothetical protein
MAGTDTLSDKAIRAALKRAASTGQPERLADGGGLRLDVQPGASGWWRLRYRFAGREGMLSLGVYPAVPLALARKRRDEARQKGRGGSGPERRPQGGQGA